MKKLVKALAIACVLSLVPMTAFAATSAQSVRNSSSNRSSSSSSSTASSTSTTATVVLSNGQTATIVGAEKSSNGTVSAGLVSSGTASAATGEAKRAGLPAAVVSTLNAIDAGNLGSVSVASGTLANKKVLATTVAIVKTTPGSQQQLVMDKTKLPASGVVEVLFYNNTNGLYTVIPATVNPATGIVTFTVPADGTAAIIG